MTYYIIRPWKNWQLWYYNLSLVGSYTLRDSSHIVQHNHAAYLHYPLHIRSYILEVLICLQDCRRKITFLSFKTNYKHIAFSTSIVQIRFLDPCLSRAYPHVDREYLFAIQITRSQKRENTGVLELPVRYNNCKNYYFGVLVLLPK